jgi:hypothetical protein
LFFDFATIYTPFEKSGAASGVAGMIAALIMSSTDTASVVLSLKLPAVGVAKVSSRAVSAAML